MNLVLNYCPDPQNGPFILKSVKLWSNAREILFHICYPV